MPRILLTQAPAPKRPGAQTSCSEKKILRVIKIKAFTIAHGMQVNHNSMGTEIVEEVVVISVVINHIGLSVAQRDMEVTQPIGTLLCYAPKKRSMLKWGKTKPKL